MYVKKTHKNYPTLHIKYLIAWVVDIQDFVLCLSWQVVGIMTITAGGMYTSQRHSTGGETKLTVKSLLYDAPIPQT